MIHLYEYQNNSDILESKFIHFICKQISDRRLKINTWIIIVFSIARGMRANVQL